MTRFEERHEITHKYCPMCMSENVQITGSWEELPIDDKGMRQVTFYNPLINCADCNEVYAAQEAVDVMHDATCFSLNRITPKRIKALRKRLGMNAIEFGKFTQIGEASIKNWEARRGIPSGSNSNYLKLVEKDPELLVELREEETGEAIVPNERTATVHLFPNALDNRRGEDFSQEAERFVSQNPNW